MTEYEQGYNSAINDALEIIRYHIRNPTQKMILLFASIKQLKFIDREIIR